MESKSRIWIADKLTNFSNFLPKILKPKLLALNIKSLEFHRKISLYFKNRTWKAEHLKNLTLRSEHIIVKIFNISISTISTQWVTSIPKAHTITRAIHLKLGPAHSNALPWKKLTSTTKARWSKSWSTVINCIDSMFPRYDVMKMAIYLCDLPSNNRKLQSSHEKNINFQCRGIL